VKAIDVALKDMKRSYRSAVGLVFMFALPLLTTVLFYFMFGNIAAGGEFDVPVTRVVVADLDEGSPELRAQLAASPGGIVAETLGEVVVAVLQNPDLTDLLEVSLAPDAASARAAVDRQEAQVAVLIPPDFSRRFAAPEGRASLEFYQDPTLTLGPGIVRSILSRFLDGLAGAKIAVDVAFEVGGPGIAENIGEVVQRYFEGAFAQDPDGDTTLVDVRSTQPPVDEASPLVQIVGPIMGGMMIFYAFYTGFATAQSILREEEERTLPRLFTTPTPQATLLAGKLLAVFLTVVVQVAVLLAAGAVVFRIRWGGLAPVGLMAAGVVLTASSFGVFFNSLLKNTRQSGAIFGGVLTVTGMIGMISIFVQGSPTAAVLGNTVALLVPQGWAVRAMSQAMQGAALSSFALTLLGLLIWSGVFLGIGVWRFSRRYG
jgi:ABC-2 type transport system permease protein